MGKDGHKGSAARRAAILAVARELFLSQGYEAVSMSAIAARVGGSKTTLWSHFHGKPALFMAVAEDLIDEYGAHIEIALVRDRPLEEALGEFGRHLLAALMSEPITALRRIVTAEAHGIAGLGAAFHEQGMARGWRIVAQYFADLQQLGRIRSDADCMRAAQHFIALCQSGCYQEFMAKGTRKPNAQMIAEDVEAAVNTFCAAYGPN